MKTKEQVIRQIKLYKFSDECWQEVYTFCRECYGPGFTKPFRGKYDCDYSQFMDWYKNGLGSGDIVRCGSTAAIINYAIGNDIYYCAYFDMDDNLVDLEGKPYKALNTNIQILSGKEWSYYNDLINSAGYRICVDKGLLVKKTRIKVGQIRRFEYEGAELYGIVCKCDNTEVTFCYGYAEGALINHEIKVSANRVYEELESAAYKRFEDEIASRYHIRWNQYFKRVFHTSQRSERGKNFYYVTDKFGIGVAKELYTKATDMRYETGDYFCREEDAKLFIKEIKALKERLILEGKIK